MESYIKASIYTSCFADVLGSSFEGKTKDEMDNLIDLLDATETDRDQFLKHYKVKKLDELRNGKYQNAISVLAKKMEKIVEARDAGQ